MIQNSEIISVVYGISALAPFLLKSSRGELSQMFSKIIPFLLIGIITITWNAKLALAGDDSCATCGGGGVSVFVDGRKMPVDLYLSESKIDRSTIRQRLEAQAKKLQSKLSADFFHQLFSGIEKLDWYEGNLPLKKLPIVRTRMPFDYEQTVRQMDGNVFIYKKGMDELSERKGRAWFDMHELVLRIVLHNEALNPNFKYENVYKVTDLLMEDELPSSEELMAKLKSFGLYPIAQSPNVASRPNKALDFEEIIEIPLGIEAELEVQQVRSAMQSCLSRGSTSLEDQTTVFNETVTGRLIRDTLLLYNQDVPTKVSIYDGGVRFRNDVNLGQLLNKYSAYIMADSKFNDRDLSDMSAYIFENTGFDQISVGFDQDIQSTTTEHMLWETIALPQLEYDLVPNDNIFSPMGDINPRLKLKRLRFAVSRKLRDSNWVIPIRNEAGTVTKLTVDTAPYMQCVQQNLEDISLQKSIDDSFSQVFKINHKPQTEAERRSEHVLQEVTGGAKLVVTKNREISFIDDNIDQTIGK